MIDAPKTYIGDGVYVEVVNGNLVLTTENGVEVTNRIFLEAEVWENLQAYVLAYGRRLNPSHKEA